MRIIEKDSYAILAAQFCPVVKISSLNVREESRDSRKNHGRSVIDLADRCASFARRTVDVDSLRSGLSVCA
jgi:hypothetical protein